MKYIEKLKIGDLTMLVKDEESCQELQAILQKEYTNNIEQFEVELTDEEYERIFDEVAGEIEKIKMFLAQTMPSYDVTLTRHTDGKRYVEIYTLKDNKTETKSLLIDGMGKRQVAEEVLFALFGKR